MARVAAEMAAAREPWWVIGSAALALHGVDPGEIADVDVLLGARDARTLFDSLGLNSDPRPDDRFRSDLFARWEEPPLAVEFMAGFAVCERGDWMPVEPVTRDAVTVGDGTLYVPALLELRMLFERFGRDKDLDRVRLIDEGRTRS